MNWMPKLDVRQPFAWKMPAEFIEEEIVSMTKDFEEDLDLYVQARP